MPRRKNKQSRKYIPMNEFRYNNSPLAKGHPNYVFGKTRDGKKYKSFGITHSPDSRHIAYKLSKNPNPNDKRTAYVQDRVQTARVDFYSKRLNGWRFDNADMPIVRHITKGYKKKTNRSSKKKKNR